MWNKRDEKTNIVEIESVDKVQKATEVVGLISLVVGIVIDVVGLIKKD